MSIHRTPDNENAPSVGPAKESAAGAGSVRSTIKHLSDETGVIRGFRILSNVNQTGGFDCPGCAWPDPDGDRSSFEYCENGAKAVAEEATKKRVTPEFFARHSIEELGRQTDHWLGKQGRITHPMILREGATHYEPIGWDDAFGLIARELSALDSPDRASFYTSGRTSNEAAYLYQLFVRMFGTNNLPDCSNMCHESSGAGLSEVIGVGKGTVRLEDFDLVDVIVVIGQNPGTNHPRMLATLKKAKERGAVIIHINPLPEAGLKKFKHPQEVAGWLGKGTQLADLFLQVRVNGDVALLKGLAKALLEMESSSPRKRGSTRLNEAAFGGGIPDQVRDDDGGRKGDDGGRKGDDGGRKGDDGGRKGDDGGRKGDDGGRKGDDGEVIDRDFVEDHTDGFDVFRRDIAATSWDDIERGAGLPRTDIENAAGLLAGTNRIIFCWAMGLTQHENAVANIQMIANILLMKGAIGIPGAGACPIRGHSNVQGDRTVGINPRPKPAFLDALAGRYGFEPPRERGLDTVDTIHAMARGDVKVFFALGGNFLSATPDTDFTAAALRRCSLTAHVSTKLNRAHLVTGRTALILPCLGRTEMDVQSGGRQMVTVENSMGIVHTTAGHLEPASGHLLSEPMIVARLATAVLGTGGGSGVDWLALASHYDLIRDEIEATIPGFAQYNVRVREPGGFYLPNSARDRIFNTASGKARFTTHEIPDSGRGEGEFLMMTIRSHDQFNTTIYGLDDRYRGIRGGRRVVFVNEADAAERGWKTGDRVDITSHYLGIERTAPNWVVVPFSIPRGCVATYFPEANVLVPVNQVAAKSNTPASKSVVVTLHPPVQRIT